MANYILDTPRGPIGIQSGFERKKHRMVYDITEADEAATDKETALRNLESQVIKGETPAIIDMYERACWNVGATVGETEAVIRRARGTRK